MTPALLQLLAEGGGDARRCRTPRRPRPCARPRPRRAPSAPRSGCRASRRRAGSRDRPRRGCRAWASPWARRNNKRPGNRSSGMSSLAQLDLLHLQPGAIGLEPPVEHPLGLVLLGRDEADGVLVQALGRELLLDVGRRSPTRNPGRSSRLSFAVLDGSRSSRAAPCRRDRAERAAHRVADDAHVRLDPAMRVERAVVVDRRPTHMVSAIGPSTASTMSARLISRRRPRQREAAAGAARRWSAGRARRAGPSASARSAAARRSRSASSVALRRAPASRRAAAVIITTA